MLKPKILTTVMEHYVSNQPIMDEPEKDKVKPGKAEDYSGDTQQIVDQIIELIDTRVRPAVAMDGGDIIFHSYDEGVVRLEMHGACSGCPSSTMTLKQGIENMLKHYVPEVKQVEPVAQ